MRWWILFVLLWGLVSYTVLAPAGGGGGGLPIPDKLAHFVAWCALAWVSWPVARATLTWSRARRVALVLAVLAAWAVATELLQGGVPGRSTDALDALADIAGAGVGVAAWLGWEAWRAARACAGSATPSR